MWPPSAVLENECIPEKSFHQNEVDSDIQNKDDGLLSSQPHVLVRCSTTERNELPYYHGEKYECEDTCNFTIFNYNGLDEGREELDMLELCVDESEVVRGTLCEKSSVHEDDNDENLSYKRMGHKELCCCKTGYVMDTSALKCRKGNLLLGQSCVDDVQCKGTKNAGRCLNGECFCEEGFVLQRLKCHPASRRLNEPCEVHLQCNGSRNAGVCGENKTCTCDKGFIKIQKGCLTGNLSLGQSCVDDVQCKGTKNAGRCLNGECFCEEGFVLQRLKCHPASRRLNEPCEVHLQCNGSRNAGVCGENKTCTCDKGFIKIQKGCLTGNLSLGQSCVDDVQCKGTKNAGRCLNGECFCEEGVVLQRLKCHPASRRLNEPCEVHLQCNGSRNAGVCGENKTCTCDKGFIKIQEGCLTDKYCRKCNLSLGQSCVNDEQCKGTENAGRCLNGECFCEEGFVLQRLKCHPEGLSSWIMDTENQLLLVVGGLFIIVVSLLIVVLVTQKKRSKKSSQMEPARKPENSYEGEIDDENIPTQAMRMQTVSASHYSEPIEYNYNNLHQKEDDKESRSGNVYDSAQPKRTDRNEEFQTESSLYNHLHEKPFQLSADIYDKPEGIPLSTNQNNTKL